MPVWPAAIATDPEGRYTFVSDAATKILGWDRDAVIGRSFTEALQKALRSMEKSDATFDWPARGDQDPRSCIISGEVVTADDAGDSDAAEGEQDVDGEDFRTVSAAPKLTPRA